MLRYYIVGRRIRKSCHTKVAEGLLTDRDRSDCKIFNDCKLTCGMRSFLIQISIYKSKLKSHSQQRCKVCMNGNKYKTVQTEMKYTTEYCRSVTCVSVGRMFQKVPFRTKLPGVK